MTEIDHRVREALHELADESRPAELIAPVLRRRARVRRRRLTVAVAGPLAAVAAVVGGTGALENRATAYPLPADRPPRVLQPDGTSSASPGASRILVGLSGDTHTLDAATGPSAFAVPLADDGAVRLAPRRSPAALSHQRLSPDGRFALLLGGEDPSFAPGIAVLDLRSGHERLLPNETASYGELSPDNRTLALRDDQVLTVVDVATGRSRLVRRLDATADVANLLGAQVGWSPDGRLLAVKRAAGTLVVDLRGRTRLDVPGTSTVNGSQSWSPDGKSLLLYDRGSGTFRVQSLDGTGRDLTRPADATTALGWAGRRVVWLAGDPGDQRLVSTDDQGHDERPWMDIRVGDGIVQDVSWSQALAGSS